MPELARCQCAKFGQAPLLPGVEGDPACAALATQEDLLCDTCRQGCGCAIPGQQHMRITNFVWGGTVMHAPGGRRITIDQSPPGPC